MCACMHIALWIHTYRLKDKDCMGRNNEKHPVQVSTRIYSAYFIWG